MDTSSPQSKRSKTAATTNPSNDDAMMSTSVFACLTGCLDRRATVVYDISLLNLLKQFKWRKINLSSVHGMEKLNVFVESQDVPCGPSTADPMVAFMRFVSFAMKELGGAIPLIVFNKLEADWKQQLKESAELILDDESLAGLFKTLEGVEIHIFQGRKRPRHISSSAEGNLAWTLQAGEFSVDKDMPDIKNAQLLIYIECLQSLPAAVKILEKQTKEERSDIEAAFLLGRTRVLIHELVHAMRFHKRMTEFHESLSWSLISSNWCINEIELCSMIATQPKMAEFWIDAKSSDSCLCPADAGRTWEHSLTDGFGIFEGNFSFVAVFCRQSVERVDERHHLDSETAAQIIREKCAPYPHEALEAVDQPRQLISFAKRAADVFRADCPAGFGLATYVSCADKLICYPFQCQSSMGWKLRPHEGGDTVPT